MVHPHNMHKVIIHLLSVLHLKCFRLQLFPFMFSDVSVSLMQPLSILCRSLRDIDTYTTGFPCGIGQGQTNIFRAVKHCLPGPVRIIIDLILCHRRKSKIPINLILKQSKSCIISPWYLYHTMLPVEILCTGCVWVW